MTEHTWTIEEVDGGSLGVGDFWKCSVCGANGGPVFPGRPAPSMPPFIAGAGLNVGDDCFMAAISVANYRRRMNELEKLKTENRQLKAELERMKGDAPKDD